jgi:hypothetical protein
MLPAARRRYEWLRAGGLMLLGPRRGGVTPDDSPTGLAMRSLRLLLAWPFLFAFAAAAAGGVVIGAAAGWPWATLIGSAMGAGACRWASERARQKATGADHDKAEAGRAAKPWQARGRKILGWVRRRVRDLT